MKPRTGVAEQEVGAGMCRLGSAGLRLSHHLGKGAGPLAHHSVPSVSGRGEDSEPRSCPLRWPESVGRMVRLGSAAVLALGESLGLSEPRTFKAARVGGSLISGPENEFLEQFQESADVFRRETVRPLCYMGLSLCLWVCKRPGGVVDEW